MVLVRLSLREEGVHITADTYADLLIARKELNSRKIKISPNYELKP